MPRTKSTSKKSVSTRKTSTTAKTHKEMECGKDCGKTTKRTKSCTKNCK